MRLDERQFVELCGIVPCRTDAAWAGSTGIKTRLRTRDGEVLQLDPAPFERILSFARAIVFLVGKRGQ